MVRLLTIVALLFAAPALADGVLYAESAETWFCTYDGRMTKLQVANGEVILGNVHYTLVHNVEFIVGTAVALGGGPPAVAFTIVLDKRTGAFAMGGAVTENPGEVTTKHGSCVRN